MTARRVISICGLMASVVSALALALSACANEHHCAGNPNEDCRIPVPDAAIDGAPGCTGDPDCSGTTPVCDLADTKACVQCVGSDAAACVGMTPTCGSDDACHACAAHTDCASDACLPDGSCGRDSTVAYVDPTGTDNTMCTKAMPCTKVLKALATARPFVKLTGTTAEQVSINNQNVTVLADPGAKLTFTSAGVILKIDGTSVVTIYDLAISDGLGGTGIGISMPPGNAATLALDHASVTNNGGAGISATGGALTVSQSTVSGNAGGGVSLSGTQFDITNCFITSNGAATTSFGGVSFTQLGAGSHVFSFNTVTGNVGAAGTTTGVVCSLITQPQTFSNNIIFGNQGTGAGTQISGSNCATAFSDIGPDTVAGTGNINLDPLFVNVAQSNFHLMGGSPAKDAADPAATLNIDFDGDARPQGPHSDIGADEVK